MARIVIYDPTDSAVANRVTRYLLSAHTPSFDGEPNKLVNPDLANVALVPQKHWKHDGAGAVVSMTQTEKDAYDASVPPPVLSPLQTAKGVQLMQPQPQTPGYEMCNKDIRLTPGKTVQADSVQDLKVNISTKLEEDWSGSECALVGVFKSDGTQVTDQADADANGVLTIWDYKAVDQKDGTTEIPFDIRGGLIRPDPAVPAAERWGHRVYVVAAPGVPAAAGGSVRLFDGYLGPYSGQDLQEVSPQARPLDPAVAAGSNVVRIYIYHPATGGTAFREHVLRLLTYRPKTTG